jgi:hypothetical protein
LWLTNALDED